MLEIPEPALTEWRPPSYTVDANGKVVGATPGTPNNWARWGDDDQRGTTNLLTPERVAAAASLVRSGKRFALGRPFRAGESNGYRPAPLHLFGVTAGDGVLLGGPFQGSDDYVVLALQAGTQLDGLAHVGADHCLYNGYWAGLVTAVTGARRLGIHHQASGVVGRAVLLDVARHDGVDRLARGTVITSDQLDAVAAAQRVTVNPGDILLVRTGHLAGDTDTTDRTEPGLGRSCIDWLHARDVVMVAVDNLAVEVRPPEPGSKWLDFHIAALRDLGLQLGEMFDLEALADDCASDGVYEGLFVANVLPVAYAVGSPLNPVFIK